MQQGGDRRRGDRASRCRGAVARHPRPHAARPGRDRCLPADPAALRVPILMLTARDDDIDKIVGLEVGADDYLTKPFNPGELVARVKSMLRRREPERRELQSRVLTHGDLRIDAGRREVTVAAEEIQLAPKEFDLLWELLDHRGMVLTRDQLLERVWGYTFAGDTRTVDVHVRQLRRKLGDASPIVTVWGVGYKVSVEPKVAQARRRCARCATAFRPSFSSECWSPPPSPPCSRCGCSRTTRGTAHSPSFGARPRASRSSTRSRRIRSVDEARAAPGFAAPILEQATGSRIYYAGVEIFPGQKSGLGRLPLSLLDQSRLDAGQVQTFEFTPPGTDLFRPPTRSPSGATPSARSSWRSHARSCRSAGSPPRAHGDRSARRPWCGGRPRLVPLAAADEACARSLTRG